MPRPPRSRVTSAPRLAEPSSDAAPAPRAALRVRGGGGAGANGPSSDSTDIYDVSDRERKKIVAENAARMSAAPNRLDDDHEGAAAADKRGRDTPERGRRQASSSVATRGRRKAPDASGLDVMDDTGVDAFGDLELDLDGDTSLDLDGESTVAVGQRSADTSSLNFALFKRGRSRQSSIVGRDDAPIRPSSRGPNTPGLSSTFSLGTFKRRAREPSILGTDRRPRAEESAPDLDLQSREDGEDDEDEIAPTRQADHESEPDAPDAESTPPPTRRRTRGSAQSESARNSLPARPSSAGSRKRKSTDAQEGSSKRPALPSSDGVRDSIEDDDDGELSLPPLNPLPSTPIQHRRRTSVVLVVDVNDEILAPPASSGSSEGSPAFWPSMRNLPRKPHVRRAASKMRKTPADDDADDGVSDMSSPPSLTHSPNYPTAREKATAAAQQRKPSPKLTTAQLTSMLPQRRRRAQSPDQWDIESDIDEPSHDGPSRRAGSRTRPAPRSAGQKAAKRPAQAQSHSTAASADKSAGKKRGAKRTYGSRSFENNSDKENQEGGGEGDSIEVATEEYDDDDASDALPDDTFDATDAREDRGDFGEELKQASAKFKEVDKWTLSYEEVTEPSSPPSVSAR